MLATFNGALDVDGGPTVEQRDLLDALARHVFGLDRGKVGSLEPDESAAALTAAFDRRIVIESLIGLELSRHPPSPPLVDRVQRYLTALGAGDDEQQLVRDYVGGERDRLAADFARVYAPPPPAVELPADGADGLAARLDALAACPEGTVGRAFHDFYARHGYAWPLDDPSMVTHDFSHVLAGYEPTPDGEVALQAMLVSATDGERHYSGLLASLLLFEVGMLPFNDLVPKEAVLARPGAAELIGVALARGVRCGVDFADLDHLSLTHRGLVELRAELRIDAPAPGPSTFVT